MDSSPDSTVPLDVDARAGNYCDAMAEEDLDQVSLSGTESMPLSHLNSSFAPTPVFYHDPPGKITYRARHFGHPSLHLTNPASTSARSALPRITPLQLRLSDFPRYDDEDEDEDEDIEEEEDEDMEEWEDGTEDPLGVGPSDSIPYTNPARVIPTPSSASLVSSSSHSVQAGVKLHIRRAPESSTTNHHGNQGAVELVELEDSSLNESEDDEDSDDSSTLYSDSNVETDRFPTSSDASVAAMLKAIKRNSSITIEEVPREVTPIISPPNPVKYNFSGKNIQIKGIPMPTATASMITPKRAPTNMKGRVIDQGNSETDESDEDEEEIESPRPPIRGTLDVEIIEIPSSVNPKCDEGSNLTNDGSDSQSRDVTASVQELKGHVQKVSRRGRPRKVIPIPGHVNEEPDDGTRRTQRKRKPTKPFMHELSVPRNRKRRAGDVEDLEENSNSNSGRKRSRETDPVGLTFEAVGRIMIESNSEVAVIKTPRRRGRPSTGRGRGRPRGSTLKNRMEREAASASVDEAMNAVLNQTTSPDSSQVDTTGTPGTGIEGSGKRRGRGAPRGPRGPRGGSRGGRRILKAKRQRVVKVKALPAEKESFLQIFEEETRMSADIKVRINPNFLPVQELEEASNMSSASTSVTAKAKKFTKVDIEERKPVTAETLFEYQWPLDDKLADTYMLQEQVSEYLGIKSFKRKYPDLNRRVVEMSERDFLRERKIVTETQADLGLTALSSNDVNEIMFNDFPEKYDEYRHAVQEKKDRELVKLKPIIPPTPVIRDKSAEFLKRVLKSASKWNCKLTKERKEERSCSFDLQSFTLNIQQSKMKILPPEATKMGYYPVTVLPGQYHDSYKKYTPAELKYLPLSTVCYGPINEKAMALIESEESESDSSESSSSDGSSSSSDDESDDSCKSGTNETSVIKTPQAQVVNGSDPNGRAICKTCSIEEAVELLIHCTKCNVPNHPSCLELSVDMLPYIKKYNWQCTECKNCIECNDPADEDKMLFCDLCDRGYHIYCVGLRKVPTGRWHCRVCSLCHSCGATKASPDDRLAEWHHEFKKSDKGTKFYTHSLCIACHKLYKKGQYCPTCLKCHLKADDKSLLECRTCEKKVHRECSKRSPQSMFGFMCDPCDVAFRSKTKIPTHLN